MAKFSLYVFSEFSVPISHKMLCYLTNYLKLFKVHHLKLSFITSFRNSGILLKQIIPNSDEFHI